MSHDSETAVGPFAPLNAMVAPPLSLDEHTIRLVVNPPVRLDRLDLLYEIVLEVPPLRPCLPSSPSLVCLL